MKTASRAIAISKAPPIIATVWPETLTSTPVSSSKIRRVFPRVPISRARTWATLFLECAKSLISRISRSLSSSRRRNARSSENPRAIACTTSRAFRASTGSAAAVSSMVTSPVAESTAIRVPVDSWSRFLVAPSGPIRTPSRSDGIRAYSMSVSEDLLLERCRRHIDTESFEEPGDIRHVPPKPFLGTRMIQRNRLAHIDHDDTVLPPEEVVLAHVGVNELRLPDAPQVRDDVSIGGRR